MAHLWEVKHRYYCNEGNYFSNDCHFKYESWADFLDEMGDADMDYNMVYRWDWSETDHETDESNFNGDVYYRNGELLLFYMGQRKAKAISCEIKVCRADEQAVIDFLKPRWEYMHAMWAPIAV